MGKLGLRKWFSRRARQAGETLAEDYVGDQNSLWLRAGLAGLALYVIVVLIMGWFWSSEPERFDVVAKSQEYSPRYVVGATTTATLINTMEVLLDKPGGYLSNDIAPPGLLLDNLPSWEYGVLIQVRDLSKAMREAFSRSLSQSTEDADLALAEPRFNFDSNSWAVPASESEYRDGIRYLKKYLGRFF